MSPLQRRGRPPPPGETAPLVRHISRDSRVANPRVKKRPFFLQLGEVVLAIFGRSRGKPRKIIKKRSPTLPQVRLTLPGRTLPTANPHRQQRFQERRCLWGFAQGFTKNANARTRAPKNTDTLGLVAPPWRGSRWPGT